jgi:hypothetical protein
MYYIFYPKQDATIYEKNSTLNSGLDQILEVGINDNYINRSLIEFDTNLINEYINDNNIYEYYSNLKLYTVEARNIPLDFNLEFYPITGSWDNGTGKQQHQPQTNNGVSWSKRKVNTEWDLINLDNTKTGSYNINIGGGNWNNNYKLTQSFNYITKDVNLNIKPFLDLWLSGSIDNNGIIIKLPNEIEQLNNINTNINFFALETNTIFQPKLIFGYDDSIYITGSSLLIPNINEMSIHPKLNQTYNSNLDKIKIDIHVREKFPKPKFTTTSSYLINYRLPETSYYSIIDDMSENVIIDFSPYTKISHLSGSNFINININSLLKRRQYRLKFKVIDINNNEVIIDYKYPFFVR